MKNYILDGKTPVKEPDIIKWAKWFEKADRVVKQTELPNDVKVSTVFLGMDHDYFGNSLLLFETMIFGGEHDQYQERCSTWEQAEQQHQEAINLIFK